jgi:hypothetical protein
VLIRYVTEVGQLAHETAELAGRTEPNAIDVLAALEELGKTRRPPLRDTSVCPLRDRMNSRNVSHTSTPPLLSRVLAGQSSQPAPCPTVERASATHSRLLPGTDMRGIMEYASISEEVPFARPLPRVPMLRVPELPPRCAVAPFVSSPRFCPQRSTPALASPT